MKNSKLQFVLCGEIPIYDDTVKNILIKMAIEDQSYKYPELLKIEEVFIKR
jgi:hypothetical protein